MHQSAPAVQPRAAAERGVSASGSDREAFPEVEEGARRLASLALFRRLKAIVDSWEREERGKARVAMGALLGLAVLAGATALAVLWQPAYWDRVLSLGFLIWVIAVLLLMRRHLRRVD